MSEETKAEERKPIDLAALRLLDALAAPAPWIAAPRECSEVSELDAGGSRLALAVNIKQDQFLAWDLIGPRVVAGRGTLQSIDCLLVAELRNAAPALISAARELGFYKAAVKGLQEEAARLRLELEAAMRSKAGP